MIGQTSIDEHLKKTRLLFDSVAWLDAHTSQVKEDILNLIREAQLMAEGVDEDNQIIGTYSYMTELISGGRKQEGDPYNLNDTGEFFRSMYIKVLSDSIVIDANYAKMEDQDWWSINILGLTQENLEKYAEMVKENYILYARKILGLD
jgi:hypothetical protein